jgi:serine/threonine protein kinase
MIGTNIGGYRVDAKLGEGGMGEVWVGVHPAIGKRVAIKVLREEHSRNAELVSRFFREARATQLLAHPGCVEIIDTGRLADGRGFLVMALLEGQSLKDRIARGRMTLPLVVGIARQIADVLQAAHNKGIIHRDLKPENVHILPDDGDPSGVRVKVLDFGVAKLTEGDVQKMTNPNALIGTPAYMAPEQCKGAQFIDAQSDIYSLGCILFEMACGRPPFVGRGFGEYLMAHLTQPVPAPSSLAQVDARLERVIVRALAKEKQQRHRSMGELIQDLDNIVRPSSPSRPMRVANANAATLMAVDAATVMNAAEAATVRNLSVPESLKRAAPQPRPTPQRTSGQRPAAKRDGTAFAVWFVVGLGAVALIGAVAWLLLH